MLTESLRRAAIEQLVGVGDESLGEWEEFTGKAFHLRRRLSTSEELLTGPAIDVRGTDEALSRAAIVMKQCPFVPKEMIYEEIN
jgi:hypothetical protein